MTILAVLPRKIVNDHQNPPQEPQDAPKSIGFGGVLVGFSTGIGCTSTSVRKKYALGKFDAKAFLGARSTAFYVFFREESEFEVKSGPKRF